MGEEVFVYTEWLKYKDKIETIIAGHLRNGWKIETMAMSGTSLMVIIFSRILVEEEVS